MDGTKKRRICGVAAFSATALASLLGAETAAARPAVPPGIEQACEAGPRDDSPATLAFKQGWPSKWEGLRCPAPDGSAVYDWWKKVE